MWLGLTPEVWWEILRHLTPEEQASFSLTDRSASAIMRLVRGHRYQVLFESMERAHEQINQLLEEEEAARRAYEDSHSTISQMMLNAQMAWRWPTKKPLDYSDFTGQPFVVFRADTRAPGEVFVAGFQRLTEERPRFGMSDDVGGIAHHLVSTSKRAEDATEFAIIRGRNPQTMVEVRAGLPASKPPQAFAWVYICLATRGFYLIAPPTAKRNRHEVAVIGIPGDQILAAIEIDVEAACATGTLVFNAHQLTPIELRGVVARMANDVLRRLLEPELALQ